MADNFETLDMFMFRRVCEFVFVGMVSVNVVELAGEDIVFVVKREKMFEKLGL